MSAYYPCKKKEVCFDFLQELLSDDAQGELSRIGMYSLASKDAFLGDGVRSTVGVFSSENALTDLLVKVRQGESVKNLKIFLKNI